MLNKKSVRILSIVTLVAVMLFVLGSSCFAVAIPSPTEASVGDLNTTVGKILGIMQWAGYAIAVVVAIVIGIKYITASPDGKAEVKKTLGFYVAGIAIVVAASSIVGAIANGVGASITSAAINYIA